MGSNKKNDALWNAIRSGTPVPIPVVNSAGLVRCWAQEYEIAYPRRCATKGSEVRWLGGDFEESRSASSFFISDLSRIVKSTIVKSTFIAGESRAMSELNIQQSVIDECAVSGICDLHMIRTDLRDVLITATIGPQLKISLFDSYILHSGLHLSNNLRGGFQQVVISDWHLGGVSCHMELPHSKVQLIAVNSSIISEGKLDFDRPVTIVLAGQTIDCTDELIDIALKQNPGAGLALPF